MGKVTTNKLLETLHRPLELRKIVKSILNNKVRDKIEERKVELKKLALQEGALDVLKGIVGEKGRRPIKFQNGQQLTVDLQTANMLLTVYNALQKDEAKQKFENMLGSNPQSFMKLVDFGWKQVK